MVVPCGRDTADEGCARRSELLVVHSLSLDRNERRVLDGVDLAVGCGQAVAIMGASGSGKTTLLHCIAGLIRPTAGHIELDGSVVSRGSNAQLAAWRLSNCGIVFQFGELLPELTLQENVELPLRLTGGNVVDARARAGELLERVGISALAKMLPGRVSGGQMQRAAIARGVAVRPRVLLADEPTGALDAEAGSAAAQLLIEVARESGSAAVIATHNPAVAAMTDRRFWLQAGRLVAAP